VYACEPPEVIVAEAGDSARWSSGPAFTLRWAELVLPAYVPVTVWMPAIVAVQFAPVQPWSGTIVKIVFAVTSPSGLFRRRRTPVPCTSASRLPDRCRRRADHDVIQHAARDLGRGGPRSCRRRCR
jgi:hypothetical protein